MQSVKLKSQIGPDGILHLDIPVGLTNEELEVMVIFQTIGSKNGFSSSEALEWPPNFFERTAGCLQDEALERHPQGEFEEREQFELS